MALRPATLCNTMALRPATLCNPPLTAQSVSQVYESAVCSTFCTTSGTTSGTPGTRQFSLPAPGNPVPHTHVKCTHVLPSCTHVPCASGTPGTRQHLTASPSCATLCNAPMCNAPMCSLHAPMCPAPPVLLMHTPPDSIQFNSIQLKQVCIRTTPRHTARVLYPVCSASVFRGAFKLPSDKSKTTSPSQNPPNPSGWN